VGGDKGNHGGENALPGMRKEIKLNEEGKSEEKEKMSGV